MGSLSCQSIETYPETFKKMNTASQKEQPPAHLATVEMVWPGFVMRFVATQERISKVMALLMPEVLEAEREFKSITATADWSI